MAIGDAVALLLGASTDFQPAAGVEDVINHVQGGNLNLAQWKDGAAVQNISEWSSAIVDSKDIRGYITNSLFLGTIAGSTGCVQGVQVNA